MAAGAAFAFYVMLRLPGAAREVFLERIRERLPERAGKIEHHVREVRGGDLYENGWGTRMSGSGSMADMVDKLFRIHARKHGLEAGESLERLELRSAPASGDPAAPVAPAEGLPPPRKTPRHPQAGSDQLDLFAA
jgi:hypothetical protein